MFGSLISIELSLISFSDSALIAFQVWGVARFSATAECQMAAYDICHIGPEGRKNVVAGSSPRSGADNFDIKGMLPNVNYRN